LRLAERFTAGFGDDDPFENLASPARLATYALSGASSVAEFDPHAFLYWPGAGLVVVPLGRADGAKRRPGPAAVRRRPHKGGAALVLLGKDQHHFAERIMLTPASTT
jgi:hypothetical protein